MTLTEAEIADIAAKVGRPRSHPSVLILVDVDKARAMREAGFSWNQVGEYFGCSGMTIHRRLRNSPKPRAASASLLALPLWLSFKPKQP